jgi:hypothetical protein
MRWHLVNGDGTSQAKLSGPDPGRCDLTNAMAIRLTGSDPLYDVAGIGLVAQVGKGANPYPGLINGRDLSQM